MLKSDIKREILERLKTEINLYKVILFGSLAYGRPETDSDVDILVVTGENRVPGSYKEKSDNYLKISRLLRDLNKKIPIDIIVMTKTQWQSFIEKKSGFAREILEHGIELI
ncbi:nucleotidyltransferase domain-containing protein [Thermodesulfobacteriota bacterium]